MEEFSDSEIGTELQVDDQVFEDIQTTAGSSA